MNCETIQNEIMAYLLGECDEQTTATISQHLEKCSGCQATMQDLEPTLGLLQDALAATTPPPAKLTTERRERVRRSLVSPGGRVILWVREQGVSVQTVAAMLTLCALIGVIATPTFIQQGEKMDERDLDISFMKNRGSASGEKHPAAPMTTLSDVVQDEIFFAEDDMPVEEAESAASRWTATGARGSGGFDLDKDMKIREGKRMLKERKLVEATEIELRAPAGKDGVDGTAFDGQQGLKGDEQRYVQYYRQAAPGSNVTPDDHRIVVDYLDEDGDGLVGLTEYNEANAPVVPEQVKTERDAIIYEVPDLNGLEDSALDLNAAVAKNNQFGKTGKMGKGSGSPANDSLEVGTVPALNDVPVLGRLQAGQDGQVEPEPVVDPESVDATFTYANTVTVPAKPEPAPPAVQPPVISSRFELEAPKQSIPKPSRVVNKVQTDDKFEQANLEPKKKADKPRTRGLLSQIGSAFSTSKNSRSVSREAESIKPMPTAKPTPVETPGEPAAPADGPVALEGEATKSWYGGAAGGAVLNANGGEVSVEELKEVHSVGGDDAGRTPGWESRSDQRKVENEGRRRRENVEERLDKLQAGDNSSNVKHDGKPDSGVVHAGWPQGMTREDVAGNFTVNARLAGKKEAEEHTADYESDDKDFTTVDTVNVAGFSRSIKFTNGVTFKDASGFADVDGDIDEDGLDEFGDFELTVIAGDEARLSVTRDAGGDTYERKAKEGAIDRKSGRDDSNSPDASKALSSIEDQKSANDLKKGRNKGPKEKRLEEEATDDLLGDIDELREKEHDQELRKAPVVRAVGVNPFVHTSDNAFSTFGIDVDTAAYTMTRNYMMRGLLPPVETVRTEEFVNFFDYDYAPPVRKTFGVSAECAPSPFGHGLHSLKIGVKGKVLGRDEQRKAVLTIAIDSSGSMNTDDRLGLVRQSLELLLGKLNPDDEVALIQYNDHARLLLPHTRAEESQKILDAIKRIRTSGSTNLEDGIALAYKVAAQGFEGGESNRVLLLSDGVANLGSGESEKILADAERYRKQGITCSVFGFGIGSYDDNMLETLADKGDGAYMFVDSLQEARRVFVEELSATLNVIAKDVKIQVEFNPKRVDVYRQLGYENRQLTKQQFRDDRVDAGEVGSGQSATALYEVKLKGDSDTPLGVVRVRYKDVGTGKVIEDEYPLTGQMVRNEFQKMSPRYRLAIGVAEFSEILRGSPHAEGSRYEDVARVLRPVALELNLDTRVQELRQLVEQAGGMPRSGL